jgi:hypothetical protein
MKELSTVSKRFVWIIVRTSTTPSYYNLEDDSFMHSPDAATHFKWESLAGIIAEAIRYCGVKVEKFEVDYKIEKEVSTDIPLEKEAK